MQNRLSDPILRRLRKKDAATVDDSVEIAISDVTGLSNALNGKVATSSVGANNGVAPLDSNGKVPDANIDFARSITEIPAATDEYTLSDGVFAHKPESPVVYALPAVTDATVTHYIILYVDCAETASIGFLDSEGNIISPLDPLALVVGDVVDFLCNYDPLRERWVIIGGLMNA